MAGRGSFLGPKLATGNTSGIFSLTAQQQERSAGSWIAVPLEIHMWGAGGAAGGTGGTTFCFGGGGAYSFKAYNASPNSYQVVVGGGGQLGTQGCTQGSGGTGGTGLGVAYQGGAGTAAGTAPCSGTGGGGGGASAFLTLAGTAIAVAGGGGGGGGTESTQNGTGQGGGGGQNGNAGQGTGASGGVAGASGTTNGASGVVIAGDHSGSGGGGGGLLGGGAGINPSNDGVSGGGGGGGTSLGDTVTNGVYQTPGNTASSFYNASYAYGGNTGQAGGGGYVVIRYLTTDGDRYTITGGAATTSGLYTLRTFTANATLSIA